MESMSIEENMKCFINMALKNTISWKALNILLDELTPTFDKSKQLNRILLKELEKVQNQDLEVETLTENKDVSENQKIYLSTQCCSMASSAKLSGCSSSTTLNKEVTEGTTF